MEEVLIPVIAITTLFLGLPWLIFHYITRWKSAATLTSQVSGDTATNETGAHSAV